jgi:hypothetical protein
LKGDENFFPRKKFGGGSKTYRKAKEHAMRRELLRLQKLVFESTSSSRGGIMILSLLDKREYPQGEGV